MNWTAMVGDCRDLPLPDESVEAVVTDPPYGLSFMSKAWDHDVPGPEYWTEVKRVMKPGAHLLAFGGTRTFHWLTVAIEEAGFEVRDCLSWMYGCLPEDAEILTEDGWVNGLEVAEGDTVAAWDPETESVQLEVVQEKTEADHDGPMVRLQNDNTDQLLTPGHRVYCRQQKRKQVNGEREVWFPDNWTEKPAGAIETWRPIKLPLAGEHSGAGIGGDDYARLLAWIWTEGGFDKAPSTGVRIYQSDTGDGHIEKIQHLIEKLVPGAKHYTREREYNGGTYTAHCWFFTGTMAQRVRSDLPDKHPTYDLLWRMDQREKRAFVRAAMDGDGSGNAFYQEAGADLEWFQTLLHTVGWQGRIDRDKGCVYLHRNPETELQSRHMPDGDMVERYKGQVWCVTVPSRAFVARWRGRVFVTGNTGFPKSHDISKAIDKAEGAEREVVGTKRGTKAAPGTGRSDMPGKATGVKQVGAEVDITAPATEQAERWDGWGTALKPAWEPIVLAMKPTDGTFAENALEHGVAGLNIDGTRIGVEGGTERGEGPSWEGSSFDCHSNIEKIDKGRWPANVTLSHLCRPTGVLINDAPEGVKTAIREYFDGYDAVRRVWGDERNASVQSRETEVLQPRVRERSEAGPAEDRVHQADLSGVRGGLRDSTGVGEGRSPEVLQPGVQGRGAEAGDGRGSPQVGDGALRRIKAEDVGERLRSRLKAVGSPELERGPVPRRAWLRSRIKGAPGRPGAGVGREDDRRKVRAGTPAGDGEGAGSAAGNERGGSPHGRRQTEQQARESGDLRPGRSQQRASGDRAPYDEAESGEPSVEVLAEDIPAGWRKYFRPYRDVGCRKVGERESERPVFDNDSGDAVSAYGDGLHGSEQSEMVPETIEDWDCPPSCPVRQLDEDSGECPSKDGAADGGYRSGSNNAVTNFKGGTKPTLPPGRGDTGGASRFYYCAKASRSEREAGLPDVEGRANQHPTVKPIDLCRWLVRLVTRKEHTVLDPFMGSGSIGCAAVQERRDYIGFDLEREYVEIARQRIEHWRPDQRDLFKDDLQE